MTVYFAASRRPF